jgi:hypothetical protein
MAMRTATPLIVPPTIAPVLSKVDVVAGAELTGDEELVVPDKLVEGNVLAGVELVRDVTDGVLLLVLDDELELVEDADEELVDRVAPEDEVSVELGKLLVPVLGLIVVGSESADGVAVKSTELVMINASTPFNDACTLVAKLDAVPQPY